MGPVSSSSTGSRMGSTSTSPPSRRKPRWLLSAEREAAADFKAEQMECLTYYILLLRVPENGANHLYPLWKLKCPQSRNKETENPRKKKKKKKKPPKKKKKKKKK